jgi:hypothetical protein
MEYVLEIEGEGEESLDEILRLSARPGVRLIHLEVEVDGVALSDEETKAKIRAMTQSETIALKS